jgi:alpha-glucosidase (family GH31 glycosyl hydrolase)
MPIVTVAGNLPLANAQFYSSTVTLQCFSQLVKMFTSLSPYHQYVVNITATTGLPAQRPLFLR